MVEMTDKKSRNIELELEILEGKRGLGELGMCGGAIVLGILTGPVGVVMGGILGYVLTDEIERQYLIEKHNQRYPDNQYIG